MNPYRNFVSEIARLQREAKSFPLGGLVPPPKPKLLADAPKALIFSPHPDDEVIIGGLALRLLREAGFKVINVAVTQGSSKVRQAERWKELRACCDYIGFGLLETRPNGLEGINLKARAADAAQWRQSVQRIAEILREQSPRVIFFPHDRDWNSSHIGTHHLVVEAMQSLGPEFSCFAVETEFWGAMDTPNLMVESSEQDVVDLISALSCHIGEVRRNPYHVRMPAWLMDNVRRGGELVGGQGGAAPDFLFATLYRLRRWRNARFEAELPSGRFLPASDNAASLFTP
jgi:LmbE family N-acetylglucosaminyl deacetylase